MRLLYVNISMNIERLKNHSSESDRRLNWSGYSYTVNILHYQYNEQTITCTCLSFVFNSISNINRVHVKSLRRVSILSRRVIVLLVILQCWNNETHFYLVFIYRQNTTELARLDLTTFFAADFCRSYMFKNNAQTEGLRLTTVSHTVERRILNTLL